jgi:hypothetical protein
MAGKWSGGAANRTWGRAGYVAPITKGDRERGRRLARELAAELFWCELCGGRHPLAEMRTCARSLVTEPLP